MRVAMGLALKEKHRDARAIETPIETGAAANGLVEVLGGIAAGDRVVVNPPASLQNGDRVERHQ